MGRNEVTNSGSTPPAVAQGFLVDLNAHITKTALVTLDVVMQRTVGGAISAGIESVLVEISNQENVYLGRHQGEQKIKVVTRKILDLIDKKLVVEAFNSSNEPRDSPFDLQQFGQAVVE